MYYDNTGGMIVGILFSAILMFSLGFAVKTYKPFHKPRKKYKLVKMHVLPKKEQVVKKEVKEEIDKPADKKKVEQKEIKKKIKKKKIIRKKKKVVKKIKKKPVKKKIVAKNPVNKEKKPKKKEEAPPVFGVTMSSVNQKSNSDFKVKVGNTLMTDDSTGWKKGKPDKIGKFTSNAEESSDGDEYEEEVVRIVKKPKPKKVFKPKYTNLAQDEEVEGKIILRLTIDKYGNVIKVKIIKGLGYGLDEEAVKAVKKFKFYPAVLSNGKTKETKITYTINFILED